MGKKNAITFSRLLTWKCSETNLKLRKVPRVTADKSIQDLSNLSGVLKCDKPNHILYSFKGIVKKVRQNSSSNSKLGSLEIEGEDAAPLDKQNLLLQVYLNLTF